MKNARRPSRPDPDPVLEPEESDLLPELLRSIDFQPESVVDAAVNNTRLFVKAAEYRMQCRNKADTAKMLWERERADQSLRLRQNAKDVGEKITEGNIEASLTVDPIILGRTEELRRAEQMDEYSKLLVEAFRMRRDCIDIVSRFTRDEMNRRQIAAETEATVGTIRKKLRDKYPGRESV